MFFHTKNTEGKSNLRKIAVNTVLQTNDINKLAESSELMHIIYIFLYVLGRTLFLK